MSNSLQHYGVKGQRWGVRRYQNEDGSLTAAGKVRSKTDYSGWVQEPYRSPAYMRSASSNRQNSRQSSAFNSRYDATESNNIGISNWTTSNGAKVSVTAYRGGSPEAKRASVNATAFGTSRGSSYEHTYVNYNVATGALEVYTITTEIGSNTNLAAEVNQIASQCRVENALYRGEDEIKKAKQKGTTNAPVGKALATSPKVKRGESAIKKVLKSAANAVTSTVKNVASSISKLFKK